MKDLIILGSSNSEIYDYIFGKNDKYFPYWASGWTARGLSRARTFEYILPLVSKLPLSSNIILNYGVSDIDISTGFKASKAGFYDFRSFLDEADAGIYCLYKFLKDFGFSNVFASVLFPPTLMGDSFFYPRFNIYPLPVRVRAQMMLDLAEKLGCKMPVISTLDQLKLNDELPALHPKFSRENVENHPDYIATQDIVWDAIKNIEGMLPRRPERLTEHYPHEGYRIDTLMKEQRPRPNTTR
ncbi:hypothetical protein [Cohaesibacter marisflavi]|uniref:hypothetical protein n=1 Tax=Cohaesibacter marisflavi TaxID=655353 RepID=UPI0029C861E9|nr:hypothetical protein [Cohaesibacter marisflavi]